MIAALAKRVFGSANDRYVRSLGKYVDAVNAFEPTIEALSDEELRRAGVGPGTIRLSVGTESIDDLIWDLEQGFARVAAGAASGVTAV